MLHNLWETLLYKPLVNLLAFLVSIIPGGDIGLAIILLTILVKFVLFPLASKSIKNQAAMAKLQPEIEKIKNSGKSKEEQARLTFELYKQNKTNPFSGCLLVLIQIPIIFALYYAFYRGVNFSPEVLYSFTPAPTVTNHMFLGSLDMSGKSIVLAVLAGISQFVQAYFMPKPPETTNKGTFGESFQKSMQIQMKYVFPVLIGFIAYSISGAIALYLFISNIFATFQQIYLTKKQKNNA
ncbi:MAG: YidC/Oxa1 family membrane protein insertase [Candidatus Paceibacterota bacterium]